MRITQEQREQRMIELANHDAPSDDAVSERPPSDGSPNG
jgi:hypothetical protein